MTVPSGPTRIRPPFARDPCGDGRGGLVLATGCWSPAFSTQPSYAFAVTSDVVYGRGEVGGGGTFVDLKLDLYRPAVSGAGAPPAARRRGPRWRQRGARSRRGT